MFSIILSKSTRKDIKRLSKEVQKHIYSEIFPILATNPKSAGERLKGPLKGLWKYKFIETNNLTSHIYQSHNNYGTY